MSVSPTVLVVQHVACETLGSIEPCLRTAGLTPRYIRVHDGEKVPASIGDAGGLIVLGGPMSVYDYGQLTYLMQEMRLIGSALAAHRPVLGICLGSQLLAHVLGAKVCRGRQKEIGWRGVKLASAAAQDDLWNVMPADFQAFHWHGDVFDLPSSAVPLASSDLTPCQAFRAGQSAYGVLFHMEVTGAAVEKMAASFPSELAAAGGDLDQLRQDAAEYLPRLAAIGERFFTGWANLAAAGVEKVAI
jgi:GMP synthase (glutamine-hydrolysing)